MATESKIGKYIKGISNEDYHADKDFVSSSNLKHAIKDHGTFRWEMSKPKEERKWDKDSAMNLGTAIHTAVLEPHLYDKEIAHIDIEGLNLRTKADKATLAQLLDANKGKCILPMSKRKIVDICRENILAHPFFRRLLEADGDAEMSGYFTDKFHGIDQRFRPDRKIYDIDGMPAILDVKTTSDLDKFRKQAKWDLNYDLSCAMYLEGDRKITGQIDVPFYFGVQETTGLMRTAVFKASDQFIVDGVSKYRRALANVKLARGNTSQLIRYQEVDYQEI